MKLQQTSLQLVLGLLVVIVTTAGVSFSDDNSYVRITTFLLMILILQGYFLFIAIYPNTLRLFNKEFQEKASDVEKKILSMFFRAVGVVATVSIFLYLLTPVLVGGYRLAILNEEPQIVEGNLIEVGGGLLGMLFASSLVLDIREKSFTYPYPGLVTELGAYRLKLLPGTNIVLDAQRN